MIFNVASDLKTRQLVWAGRKHPTHDQTRAGHGGNPITVEGAWIAGVYAAEWHDEAIARLPQWED